MTRHRLRLALLLLLLLASWSISPTLAHSRDVNLAWDRSASDAGNGTYKIYWGNTSQLYLNVFEAGNVTRVTIKDLADSSNWYFAATYADYRGESGYSNEVYVLLVDPPIAAATGVDVFWSEVGQTMAFFGIQTEGTFDLSSEDMIRAAVAAPTSNGTTTKITVFLKETLTSNTHICKCLLYDADDNLIGETNSRQDITTVGAWYDFTIEVPVTSGASYSVAFWGNSGTGAIRMGSAAQTGEGRNKAQTYGTAPDPITWGTNPDNYRYSIYVTYTEVSSGNPHYAYAQQ